MRFSWSMIYSTLQNMHSLNRSSYPTFIYDLCTRLTAPNKLKLVTHTHTHTPLLRFDVPLPILKITAFRWIAFGSDIHRSFWSQWYSRRTNHNTLIHISINYWHSGTSLKCQLHVPQQCSLLNFTAGFSTMLNSGRDRPLVNTSLQ
jgi:hypothetical protein